MKKRLRLMVVLAFLVTAGCAGVEIARVTDKNADTAGVRFYRPWPYLLVVKNPDGTLTAKTVYLPKTDEEYVIKVKSGLGTVNASFELVDGWQLIKLGDIRDSKVPETINALAGLTTSVSGVITKAGVTPLRSEPLPPGLYRFEFDEKTGFVKGLVPASFLKEQ